MIYVVPNVPLIPQTKNMACWYASAQMLVQWRRNKTMSTERAITDPSEDPASVKKWIANNGINDAFIMTLVADLGLQAVPPLCPTSSAIESWLRNYGPLWVNGTSHITVIAGVDTGTEQVYVNDPWPPNVGKQEWRGMAWLMGIGSTAGVDSLDPSTDSGVFLHCP
jgi:hypothetical protein